MSILIVTGIEGARNCAAVVAAQLGMEVEVADGRKAALTALRRREYAAVAVDETMAECDPASAEAVWEHSGLAIPLQINFALSGASKGRPSPSTGAATSQPMCIRRGEYT